MTFLHVVPVIAGPFVLLILAVWLRRPVRRHLKEQS